MVEIVDSSIQFIVDDKNHMSSIKKHPVIDIIYQQALTPPGGDPYIGTFYQSFIDFCNDGHPMALDLIEGVQSERQLTPALHANLLFRAVQANLLNTLGYPNEYLTKERWDEHLTGLFSNGSYELVRKILLEKDTTTTIYQRYAGERALMSMLAQGKPIRAADIGCGGNYGLPGIEINEPFKPIIDHTLNQIITGYLNSPLELEQGLSIDIHDPYSLEEIQWRHACGLYPKELMNGELIKIQELEKRLTQSRKVTFHHGDLLNLESGPDLPFDDFDYVIMNTMLYQHQKHARELGIRNARRLLKPHGVLFIQDFAEKDPDNPTQLLYENISWGQNGAYRLFLTNKRPDSQMYEALRWKDGRCSEVSPGTDFYRINALHSIT